MHWYYLGELVAALLLAATESAWAPWLKIAQQAPALVLVLVVLVGMFRGPVEGAWTGLVGALCLGALTSFPLGGLFAGFMGCGVAAGLLGQQVVPDRISVLMFVVFLGVIGARVVGLIFMPPPRFGFWMGVTLIQACYSAVASIPLAWLARIVLARSTPFLGRRPFQRRLFPGGS